MSATTSDPRIPPRETCVTRHVLEHRAKATPDRDYIRLADGTTVAYGAFAASVERAAAGLAALGVKQGDTVVVWSPNSVEMVRVWFAINWLGAIYVPINTAYRGNLLAHVIANADARVIVASVDLIPRLADIDRASLETVVALGGPPAPVAGLNVVGAAALDGDPATIPALARPIEPWDVQSIIYTSGTTGRSKGVVSTYAHLWHMSGPQAFNMLDEDDCMMVCGPLFHVAGTLPIVAMLNRGGAVSMVGDFETEKFWPAVRATRTTFAILLGVMAAFLAKRPPSPEDRNHTLKKAMMIPLPDDSRDFAQRFGVDVWTLFNMTEINVPLISQPNPGVVGTCGKPRAGVELRIVDENDCEVAVGVVGELMLRAEAPWALNSGYFRNDEATAKAWRNGWFHTGDAFRRDADDNFFFVDRMKDAIRRRGENISSFEVEVEILAHPAVRECAVVAVPSELSEDDVLAIVATAPGAKLDPLELLEFLKPRLAHFMLPRYIRVMSDLPRTPTQKVEKYVLRQQGLTPDTWDRDKAGVKIRRDRIRA